MNADDSDRPKPKTLIVLSVVGLLGSALLDIPVLLYVFAAFAVIFILHYFITK